MDEIKVGSKGWEMGLLLQLQHEVTKYAGGYLVALLSDDLMRYVSDKLDHDLLPDIWSELAAADHKYVASLEHCRKAQDEANYLRKQLDEWNRDADAEVSHKLEKAEATITSLRAESQLNHNWTEAWIERVQDLQTELATARQTVLVLKAESYDLRELQGS